MKSKGIVKKGTKPPSLTVCMIIYEGKSKESVISMLEYWDNLTIFLVTELKIAAFLNTKKCTFITYTKNVQQKNRMKCQILKQNIQNLNQNIQGIYRANDKFCILLKNIKLDLINGGRCLWIRRHTVMKRNRLSYRSRIVSFKIPTDHWSKKFTSRLKNLLRGMRN